MHKGALALGALVALSVALIVAYEKKYLNKWLPAKWQKEGFVGAFGRTPEMEGCLHMDASGRFSGLNRCTYV